METTEFKVGDVVESGDQSIYIVKRVFVDAERRTMAVLDTIEETYDHWKEAAYKALPVVYLNKITELDNDK